MPREMWTWQVNLEVADLSTEQKLAAVGLRAPIPGRHGWIPFQRAGEQLARAGWRGLLSPSAARPSDSVLCLFRNTNGMSGAKPVPPPRRIAEPPPPPTGLRT